MFNLTEQIKILQRQVYITKYNINILSLRKGIGEKTIGNNENTY